MPPAASEPDNLQQRLAGEIEQALMTCDDLGLARVGCHLQMARDLLADETWRAAFPQDRAESAPPDLVATLPGNAAARSGAGLAGHTDIEPAHGPGPSGVRK
jgi:hypothetical protein